MSMKCGVVIGWFNSSNQSMQSEGGTADALLKLSFILLCTKEHIQLQSFFLDCHTNFVHYV